ncbi:iron-containing redox enzyme family protein [Nostoc sp. JL33]|uniref:iron-containing redox enzyme family protein n=1 Tax=Nostoc sp. JL33 TaxID=2815396 RepID=UPI0025FAA6D4|nr:iron-containing redox enzyme family protein [Nostoc sp. JL33]
MRYYIRNHETKHGSLAMPEFFHPNRNRAVVAGLERLYPDARVKCEYFFDHIEVDEVHSGGWLNNAIAPIVEVQPEAGLELAIGGALRMEAMRRYNQYLPLRLGVKPE